MSATIEEHRLGEKPWLVVSGERTSAFRLLGEHQARNIRTLVFGSNTKLQAMAAVPEVAKHLTAVSEQSRLVYPDQWSELVAMAEGADIPLDVLVLFNLSGDIGVPPKEVRGDETEFGCTDVAFRDGDSVFLAHNEDGAPHWEPYCSMLTLRLDGEPAVTAYWYPGFLPSVSFSINEYGLLWGVDNIAVTTPAVALGRHFVGRAMQSCRTITEAIGLLRDQPSAGGFAYTVGQIGNPHAVQVEAAAGYYASRSTQHADKGMLWHSNHLHLLPSALDSASENSLTRAKTAGEWTVPPSQPVDWCLEQLAHASMPDGVRQDGNFNSSSFTLATFVTDLSTATTTVAPCNQAAISIPAYDLANGLPERQSLHVQYPKVEHLEPSQ